MAFSLDMGGWVTAGTLAVVLGSGCLWFRHEARQALADAGRWQETARMNRLAFTEAMTARQALEEALVEHQIRVQRLEKESAAMRAKIREATRYDETVRLWYDNPLPVPLSGLLTHDGDTHAVSSPGDASSASADPHAGSYVSGDDQRRPVGMGAGEPGGAAHVQCGQGSRGTGDERNGVKR